MQFPKDDIAFLPIKIRGLKIKRIHERMSTPTPSRLGFRRPQQLATIAVTAPCFRHPQQVDRQPAVECVTQQPRDHLLFAITNEDGKRLMVLVAGVLAVECP